MSDEVVFSLELLESGNVIVSNWYGKVLVEPGFEEDFAIAAAHIAGLAEAIVVNTDTRPYSRVVIEEETPDKCAVVGTWEFDDTGDCVCWTEGLRHVDWCLTQILTGDLETLSDCFLHEDDNLVSQGFEILEKTDCSGELEGQTTEEIEE